MRDFAIEYFASVLAFCKLQSDAVSWGSNVLNYCQLIARSNLGYLFAAANGVLTFKSRNQLLPTPAAVTFADDGTGIPYGGISASVGSDRLRARVSVDREGGTAQTSTVADPAQWIIDYGPLRSLSIPGLLLNSDTQSDYLADELLALYSEPVYRISEIAVDITSLSTGDQDDVLALDILSRVDVTFTPDGVGDPITQELVIQGIRHTIGVDRHVITFSFQVVTVIELGPL
jgi:hypothetical protein